MTYRVCSSSALALAVAAAIALSSSAHADDATDSSGAANQSAAGKSSHDALEEIVIQAQRSTSDMARAAQQQAPNLINVTTAEEMSRLPDVNTGEAVRRIPGISLETDTGEGRYVNIRGLDADLNSTTFGGLRLPPTNTSSPSGSGRAVAFDSIPLGFVGAITVTKSNLPEQDAEALGGTIDITPKTAPSDGRPFMDVKLGTGYEEQRKTWITDVSLTTGTRFGGGGGYDPFSILFTGSGYTDKRGIDDAEAGFIDGQPAIADKAYAGFEQRYYQYHRVRYGYGLDLGYAPDDGNKYFVRYYDAGYSETVIRNRLEWNYSGAPTADPANPNGFLDTAQFAKTLRDEKEFLDSKVFEIGGKNLIGGNTLDYHVGYTRGTYDKPYDYNSTFENPATANVSYDNTSDPNYPVVKVLPGTAGNGTVNVNPADPAGYVLTKLGSSTQHSNDHEVGIGINLAMPTHFTDRVDEEFKVGFNARLRDKTGDATSYKVSGLPALALGSAVSGGNVTFYNGHYQNGPNIDGSVLRGIYAASSNISSDPVATALNVVKDKEDVYAAYGQYQFGYGALGVVAGARLEHTKATYAGNKNDQSPNPQTAGCTLLADGSTLCPVSNERSYTNLFPTAQARYEFSPDLIGRLALSSTIARPGFQQVTATTVVASNQDIVTGNPNLKPTSAYGLDATLEHYLPHAGIVSGGLFAKQIKDYIVTNVRTLTYQNTGGLLGLAKEFSYANAPTAHLYGVELNYVQRFKDQLPGALGGLGVSVNWAWVQSKYEIRPGEDSLLPSTSRNTVNAELLYDYAGLNMTLGAYYTSRNIFGVAGSAATDVWTQERTYLDFGGQYKVSKPLSFYLNVKNITNTPLKLTEGPGANRVIQREFYSTTYQFGLTYSL
ncbi:MAG: hypothetical protein RL684_1821 [Pseudomonadota bacterium]|jgi:TonB-dependent receptor